MTCNCDTNTILCTKGTSLNLTFNFDSDISSYTSAVFVVRKDYNTNPVISKTVTGFSGKSLNLTLAPSDTEALSDFENGKNQARYIWGLDFIDTANSIRIPAFPNTGDNAPIFMVYKHVATS